jgi:hypothetical protein
LRITSGLIVQRSGASAPFSGEGEHGCGSFSFLSLVLTTLSIAFANDSKHSAGSDFTFCGSGGVGNFTFSGESVFQISPFSERWGRGANLLRRHHFVTCLVLI